MNLKYFILGLSFLYFIFVFLVPVLRTYKRTGKNPITYRSGDSAHNFVGHCLFVLMFITIVMLVIFCFFEKTYPYLLPIPYLQTKSLQTTGIIIMSIAIFWVVLAQYQMRESWRIGIDADTNTPLIAYGLFRISRNPIYFGILISTTGLFLALPNMVSFMLLVEVGTLIQIQIRLEEEFLLTQHGEAYREYCRKVRRFI